MYQFLKCLRLRNHRDAVYTNFSINKFWNNKIWRYVRWGCRVYVLWFGIITITRRPWRTFVKMKYWYLPNFMQQTYAPTPNSTYVLNLCFMMLRKHLEVVFSHYTSHKTSRWAYLYLSSSMLWHKEGENEVVKNERWAFWHFQVFCFILSSQKKFKMKPHWKVLIISRNINKSTFSKINHNILVWIPATPSLAAFNQATLLQFVSLGHTYT